MAVKINTQTIHGAPEGDHDDEPFELPVKVITPSEPDLVKPSQEVIDLVNHTLDQLEGLDPDAPDYEDTKNQLNADAALALTKTPEQAQVELHYHKNHLGIPITVEMEKDYAKMAWMIAVHVPSHVGSKLIFQMFL